MNQDYPVNVVKHGKRRPSEPFQVDKLHASIIATCRSLRTPEAVANTVADKTCVFVVQWMGKKSEITTGDIRLQATKYLDKSHPEAAYIYKRYHHIM